jgi:oligopeptidase B
VRGGGDDTMEWADSARTWRRENSVQDFENVIRSAQKLLGVSGRQTVVYGRSAGGLLIGAAAARQKGTTLFAGLYGEVPYLDVLRTTTNTSLPLTVMEFNEFGNPGERLEDLVTLGRISPMEGIPAAGYPELFALIRTGANDKEVFAYEPVKWILKSRGNKVRDANKLLAFEADEGHFVNGATGLQHRAEDLALLLAWRQSAPFRLA